MEVGKCDHLFYLCRFPPTTEARPCLVSTCATRGNTKQQPSNARLMPTTTHLPIDSRHASFLCYASLLPLCIPSYRGHHTSSHHPSHHHQSSCPRRQLSLSSRPLASVTSSYWSHNLFHDHSQP